MTDSSDRKPRRVRYQGKNPRSFQDKYKELQPDKYPEDVAKVIAAGKTPAGSHRPIMVNEILSALNPKPGDFVADCTLGFGGHARELLAAIQPGGRFLGIDVDPIELPKTELRLRSLGYDDQSIVVSRTNFAGIQNVFRTEAPLGVQVILADLGVSSMQLDDPSRGFTFKSDGPLDMRMNPNRGASAATLLNGLDVVAFAAMLEENSDEPHATQIARAILDANARVAIETTLVLAEVIRVCVVARKQCGIDDVSDATRRVFQSLRIAVNDEFAVLDAFLKQVPQCLTPGGRVAILTFHSGEDRRVKNAFKSGLANGMYQSIAGEVTRASIQEQHANPRSKSAKLRFAVRA